MKFPVVKKMRKDLLREKTFVFAILLELLLILSIYVVLGFSSLFFAPENLLNLNEKKDIGVIGRTGFTPYLNGSRYVNLVVYEDAEEAVISFEQGILDAVVVENSKGVPKNYTIYLPDSQIQSTIILSILKDRFELYEDTLRREKIDANAVPLDKITLVGREIKGADYSFELLYGLLIPFLLLLPAFLIGSLVIDNISEEIERKTMNLLLIATSFKRIVAEVVLATIIMLLAQILVWFGFLRLQGIVIANYFGLAIYLVLFTVLVVLVGVLLAVTLKTKTKAQLIYSLMVMGISVTLNATPLNPVNVISRLSLGLESVGFAPYLILVGLIIVVYLFLAGKKTTEELA
jgi:ABC-2 type transport system permease protein